MEQLFQFSIGIKKLSHDEFMGFVKSLGRKSLSNIFFNAFQYQLENKNNTNECKIINNNISKIIQNRTKSQQTKNRTNFNVKKSILLNKLPNEMISNISSFLNFADNQNLELADKSIFISTRSPISLYKVDTDHLTKCFKWIGRYNKMYIFNRFKALKRITIEHDTLCEFNNDDDRIARINPCFDVINWKNVEYLKFDFRESPSYKVDYVIMHEITKSHFNLVNLQEVNFFLDTETYGEYILNLSRHFINIINSKSNINYWEFDGDSLTGTIENIDIDKYKANETLEQVTLSEIIQLNASNSKKFANIKQLNLELLRNDEIHEINANNITQLFPSLESISINSISPQEFDLENFFVQFEWDRDLKIKINNTFVLHV